MAHTKCGILDPPSIGLSARGRARGESRHPMHVLTIDNIDCFNYVSSLYKL